TYTYTKDVLSGAALPLGTVNFSLDPAGRFTQRKYSDATILNYSYDAKRENASADGAVFFRDGNGQITGPNGLASRPDALGRVVAADRNLPASPGIPAGAETFTYDAASQLAGATYDLMGRVTAQGGRKYTWDLASRMTGFNDADISATYSYDALGEIATIAT